MQRAKRPAPSRTARCCTPLCRPWEPGRFLCSFCPKTGELDEGAAACCCAALLRHSSCLPPPCHIGGFAGRVPSAFAASRGGTAHPPLWGSQAINIGGGGGVTRGSRAKAQPDTTSPSFTVTFCQMPVGTGVAYLLAYTPVTFTALARCLLAVFTLIYSSLLHPHLFPPPCY